MTGGQRNSLALTKARQLTDEGREKAARSLLEWEIVMNAIRSAAATGYDHLELAPPLPVNVKDTETGKATFEKLAQLGFAVRWEVMTGGLPGSQVYRLEIYWG